MTKSLLITLILLCLFSQVRAETSCPANQDFLISNFEAKSPNFDESERANIEYIAEQVIANLDQVTRIDVFGHTATWPGLDLQSLSEQRAEQVLDSIVAEVEQSIGREVEFYIYYWGMADECPIASNDTQAGRATNRRVAVNITKGKSNEETAADKHCRIADKLRKADTDALATSKAQASRLKFLKKFIANELCGEPQDDRFYLFQAKNGMGKLVDKCGTSQAIFSAKLRDKKGRVMRGFRKGLKAKIGKKKLAKKVLWTEELITCETNKVLGALFSLASDTPTSALRKSDECKALRKMRTASYRTAPDQISVYRGWQRMISKAASKHC